MSIVQIDKDILFLFLALLLLLFLQLQFLEQAEALLLCLPVLFELCLTTFVFETALFGNALLPFQLLVLPPPFQKLFLLLFLPLL